MYSNIISVFFFIALLFILPSCSHQITSSNHSLEKWMNQNEHLKSSFHGYTIYNLATKKVVARYNDEKLLTPASNTKLLTFYAAKKLLPPKLPVVHYALKNDTLFIRGNGNPAFLYLKDSSLIAFIQSFPGQVAFTDENSNSTALGNGWMWQDLTERYSPENSSLPIASNFVSIQNQENSLLVFPALFKKNIQFRSTQKAPFRTWNNNEFVVDTTVKGHFYVPYITSPMVTCSILEELCNRKVVYRPKSHIDSEWLSYGAFERDSILKPMHLESDNFLAEQLIWLIGAQFQPNHLNVEATLKSIEEKCFSDKMPQPKWVDGSGLSRYNLISPKFLLSLLTDLYSEQQQSGKPMDELLQFFPKAGVSGSLKSVSFYPPTTYAKTGTMSNVHNLSGYLITQKGTPLCFSFMNNHYMIPTDVIRREMSKVLWELYNKL